MALSMRCCHGGLGGEQGKGSACDVRVKEHQSAFGSGWKYATVDEIEMGEGESDREERATIAALSQSHETAIHTSRAFQREVMHSLTGSVNDIPGFMVVSATSTGRMPSPLLHGSGPDAQLSCEEQPLRSCYEALILPSGWQQ